MTKSDIKKVEKTLSEDKDEAQKNAAAYYQLGLEFLKKKEVAYS